jgi:hypothetical protein
MNPSDQVSFVGVLLAEALEFAALSGSVSQSFGGALARGLAAAGPFCQSPIGVGRLAS